MDDKKSLVSFSLKDFLLFKLHICLLSVVISLSPVFSDNHTCVKQDLCSCKGSDGIINLHSLASTGKPTFHTVTNNFMYYYNPCFNFTLSNKDTNTKCNNVAACRYSLANNTFEDIGKQDSVKFAYNMTRKQLFMKYNTGNKTTQVYLRCGVKIKFAVLGSTSNKSNNYIFELTSPCACPNGCPVNTSPDSVSAGTVLCIIFIICVSTYLVVGILYKKAVEGASGIDLLPHTTFWTSLPGLIKDGYLFFISPCLGDRVEYKSYERL